jgi:hypothetical protein
VATILGMSGSGFLSLSSGLLLGSRADLAGLTVLDSVFEVESPCRSLFGGGPSGREISPAMLRGALTATSENTVFEFSWLIAWGGDSSAEELSRRFFGVGPCSSAGGSTFFATCAETALSSGEAVSWEKKQKETEQLDPSGHGIFPKGVDELNMMGKYELDRSELRARKMKPLVDSGMKSAC